GPGADPLGKRLDGGLTDDQRVWRQVVGVVQSTRNAGLDQPPRPHVYLPVEQYHLPANFLLVRAARPSADLVKAVREAVAEVDKDQSVFLMASLEEGIADSLARQRFVLLLRGLCRALALLLAG